MLLYLSSTSVFQNQYSYSKKEDDAVEDCHGNGDGQRLTFGDADVQLWRHTWTHVATEEERNLL